MSNDWNGFYNRDDKCPCNNLGGRGNRPCSNPPQDPILPIATSPIRACCCKDALRHSIDLLLNPCLRKFINLTSFTLIGQNFTTSLFKTTIKSISNCGESLITFSESDCKLSVTTFCDLIAIRFKLLNPTATTVSADETDEEIAAIFSTIVQRLLPRINPNQFCCTPEGRCCCNRSKASFLANSIGPVNVQLNTSTQENPLMNQAVITVTEHIAWFIDSSNTVTICCLDGICALG